MAEAERALDPCTTSTGNRCKPSDHGAGRTKKTTPEPGPLTDGNLRWLLAGDPLCGIEFGVIGDGELTALKLLDFPLPQQLSESSQPGFAR